MVREEGLGPDVGDIIGGDSTVLQRLERRFSEDPNLYALHFLMVANIAARSSQVYYVTGWDTGRIIESPSQQVYTDILNTLNVAAMQKAVGVEAPPAIRKVYERTKEAFCTDSDIQTHMDMIDYWTSVMRLRRQAENGALALDSNDRFALMTFDYALRIIAERFVEDWSRPFRERDMAAPDILLDRDIWLAFCDPDYWQRDKVPLGPEAVSIIRVDENTFIPRLRSGPAKRNTEHPQFPYTTSPEVRDWMVRMHGYMSTGNWQTASQS